MKAYVTSRQVAVACSLISQGGRIVLGGTVYQLRQDTSAISGSWTELSADWLRISQSWGYHAHAGLERSDHDELGLSSRLAFGECFCIYSNDIFYTFCLDLDLHQNRKDDNILSCYELQLSRLRVYISPNYVIFSNIQENTQASCSASPANSSCICY